MEREKARRRWGEGVKERGGGTGKRIIITSQAKSRKLVLSRMNSSHTRNVPSRVTGLANEGCVKQSGHKRTYVHVCHVTNYLRKDALASHDFDYLRGVVILHSYHVEATSRA